MLKNITRILDSLSLMLAFDLWRIDQQLYETYKNIKAINHKIN